MQQRVMDSVKRSQETPQPAPQSKQDFKGPFSEQADITAKRRAGASDILKQTAESKSQQMVEKANEAIANQSSAKADLAAYDELEKITPEDLALAEQLIFKGYAEKDVTIPNLPNNKFTICSTSAEEMSIIDEVLYDMIKEKEDAKGDVDLPAQYVNTMRQALFLAFGFRGVNGKDVCDLPIEHLNTLKKAAVKVKDLEYTGDMESAKSLMKSLKKALIHRAVQIRKFPTPVIDYVANKKTEFDGTMYIIMMADRLIPKSSGQPQGTQEATSSAQEEVSSLDQ
ncbi:MAG TPA: hypothetical protein VMW42_06205 [Desulfatiglandales bacterium]|nr:hypothetical protein [Desulfatiglandales bacterium]